jgi:hypothetical protein
MILFRAEKFGLQENVFFSARENSVCKKNDFFCAGKFGLQK